MSLDVAWNYFSLLKTSPTARQVPQPKWEEDFQVEVEIPEPEQEIKVKIQVEVQVSGFLSLNI